MYTGYNTLSMALAMPHNGRVVACEIEDTYVNIAKPFFEEVREMSLKAAWLDRWKRVYAS